LKEQAHPHTPNLFFHESTGLIDHDSVPLQQT
jgi:hypothetical protein